MQQRFKLVARLWQRLEAARIVETQAADPLDGPGLQQTADLQGVLSGRRTQTRPDVTAFRTFHDQPSDAQQAAGFSYGRPVDAQAFRPFGLSKPLPRRDLPEHERLAKLFVRLLALARAVGVPPQ